MKNLVDYGFIPAMMPENVSGTPAPNMAVHKDCYELICEYGRTYGRLKTSIYFGEGNEGFPTAGDFVLIQYNCSGDSQILKTLERKTKFVDDKADFLLEKSKRNKSIAQLSRQNKKNGGPKE